MTTKKRNRNKAKTGKTASASDQAPEAAAAAAADQVTEKAQQHRQLQIGNDNNAATICSHGLVVAKVDDKEKEMFTKRVLAKCDDLALAKESTPCDFQAIDRFLIGMDLLPTPSTDGVRVLSRIYFYLEKLMEEEQCNAEKIGMAVVIFFAHGDPGETSAGISQWVSSHFLAAGVQHLIQGDIETARAYAYFNCFWEIIGSIYKHTKSVDFTKMIEMRMSNTDLHTLLSYFRKRIPCSCLDRRYKQVKSMKKIGYCFNPLCSNITDPKSLMCCSYCRQANYCSSKCQAADWKVFHKKVCGPFKNIAYAVNAMSDDSMTYEDFKKAEYFKDFNVIEQAVFDCDCACVSVIKENKNNTESSVGVGEIGTDK
jgi:hypothetical protein